MTSSQIIAFIVIPLIVFLFSAAGGGIAALVKFVSYMSKSQVAQEETAKTNAEISKDLKHYMAQTDGTLLNHTTKLAVHDSQINALQNGRAH